MAYDSGLVEKFRTLVPNANIFKCWSEVLLKSIKFFLKSGGATMQSSTLIAMRNPNFDVASSFEEIVMDIRKHNIPFWIFDKEMKWNSNTVTTQSSPLPWYERRHNWSTHLTMQNKRAFKPQSPAPRNNMVIHFPFLFLQHFSQQFLQCILVVLAQRSTTLWPIL